MINKDRITETACSNEIENSSSGMVVFLIIAEVYKFQMIVHIRCMNLKSNQCIVIAIHLQ